MTYSVVIVIVRRSRKQLSTTLSAYKRTTMVVYCWVQGCKNKGDKTVKRSFHYIPKIRRTEGEQTLLLSIERRRVWLANIHRKQQPSNTARICSDHFISGKPADLYDRSNPDWAPTLKLTDTATPSETDRKRRLSEANLKRYERVKYRSRTKDKFNPARALLDFHYRHGARITASPLPGPTSELPSSTSEVQLVTTWTVVPHEQLGASDSVCGRAEVLEARTETINQSDEDDSIIEVIIN